MDLVLFHQHRMEAIDVNMMRGHRMNAGLTAFFGDAQFGVLFSETLS